MAFGNIYFCLLLVRNFRAISQRFANSWHIRFVNLLPQIHPAGIFSRSSKPTPSTRAVVLHINIPSIGRKNVHIANTHDLRLYPTLNPVGNILLSVRTIENLMRCVRKGAHFKYRRKPIRLFCFLAHVYFAIFHTNTPLSYANSPFTAFSCCGI